MTAPSEHGAVRVPWQLELPSGTLQITADGVVTGAEGTLTLAEARQTVWSATEEPAWYAPAQLGRSVFKAGVLFGLVGPLTAFLLAVLSLSIFVGPAVEEWRKFGLQILEALR